MDPITTPPQQVQQPTPMAAAPSPESKKIGPIVAVLVIVLILIIGALYIFASRMNTQPMLEGTNDTATTQESVQPVTNDSDEVSSIEADLNGSIDGLDSQNF
ncbi:MAG: hypothetical protein AAB365_02350 [Patescibacteria group bacterium]